MSLQSEQRGVQRRAFLTFAVIFFARVRVWNDEIHLAAAEESLFAFVSREEVVVEKRTAVVVTHPDGACCVGLRMSI